LDVDEILFLKMKKKMNFLSKVLKWKKSLFEKFTKSKKKRKEIKWPTGC